MKRQNGQNVFEYTVSQLNFRVHATVLCSMNREIQLRHRVNDSTECIFLKRNMYY